MTTPNFGQNSFNAGVPSQNVNIINATFEKIFSKAFETAQPQASFVQQKSSTGKFINMAGLLQQPMVRIWKDQKRANSLNYVFTPVPMAPLEASIRIDKYDMMGDAVGLYGDAVASLAGQAKLFTDLAWTSAVQSGWPNEYAALQQGGELDFGESGTILGDGLALFASGTSGHTWTGTNVAAQGNVINGSLSDPQTWGNAVTMMRSFVGDKGQPLRVNPVGVVYGPNDEYAINNALDAKWSAVDARPTITSQNAMPKVALDNVMARYGLSLNRVDSLYTNPGVAYLIGEVNGIASSYQYMLDPLHLVPSVDPSAYNVFFNREFIWSVEGFGRVIVPTWFTIVRVADLSIAQHN